MTRQRISGLWRTLRRRQSEMATLEKSMLVMELKPASYRCSERRELPQPGTRIWGCGGRWESKGFLSSDHSAYHSKASSVPRMVKNLSQFSLLVKSPRVPSNSASCSSFFPILRLLCKRVVNVGFIWGLALSLSECCSKIEYKNV